MKQIKSLIVLATAFALIFGATAQQQQPPRSKGLKKVPTYQDVRYGAERIMHERGDSTSDRLLDLYLPATERPAAGFPVVMFIHGGAFSHGDKAVYASTAGIVDSLLAHGYAVASINYYLGLKGVEPSDQAKEVPRGNGPAKDEDPVAFEQHLRSMNAPLFAPANMRAIDDATDDAIMAMHFLYDNAGAYGLDLSRLALMGGSAGAVTCIYSAYVKHASRPRVRAVIDCWGAIADLQLITDPNLPMLTLHGTADETVVYANGVNLQNRLKEIGNRQSRLITLEGLGHAQYRYVGQHLMGDVVTFLDEVLK